MAAEVLQCPICGGGNPCNWRMAPDRFHGLATMYRLVRCNRCSMVWLANPPNPEELAQHYGCNYDDFIASAAEADIEAHWRGTRSLLNQYKTAGSILDIGCGSGGFLAALKGRPWKLHGIEMSEASAARARERTGAQVFSGDVLHAPFSAGAFDAITCFNVLEHTYQPRDVLSMVNKWLAPDGVFIAYLPNIDSGGARVFQSYWYGLEVPRHLFHFCPESLSHVAHLVGFEDVRISTHRESFFELSVRYIADDVLRKVGLIRAPTAQMKRPSLAWRAARKFFRITTLPVLNLIIGFAGRGEIIHAIFRKPASVQAVRCAGGPHNTWAASQRED